METTSSRLQQLMTMRNLKQIDVIQLAEPFCQKYRIKMNKSDISQFVSGKVKPGQWKLTILGLALDVSEEWLMGYDVPMERTHQPPTYEDEKLLNDDIIRRLCQLTPEELSKVDAFIQGLLASR